MKKILFMMLALMALDVNVQGIKSGSKWNISNLEYEAKDKSDYTITFTAIAEGKEQAFRLTPNRNKKNVYALSENPNSDNFNPFCKSPRAKYIEQQRWKLICLYDQKDNCTIELIKTEEASSDHNISVTEL